MSAPQPSPSGERRVEPQWIRATQEQYEKLTEEYSIALRERDALRERCERLTSAAEGIREFLDEDFPGGVETMACVSEPYRSAYANLLAALAEPSEVVGGSAASPDAFGVAQLEAPPTSPEPAPPEAPDTITVTEMGLRDLAERVISDAIEWSQISEAARCTSPELAARAVTRWLAEAPHDEQEGGKR